MLRELSSTRSGLADGLACTVFQVPSPVEGVATEGLALSITPNTGRDIQVYVLARSSYPPTARSMIGTSKDDDYQFKIGGARASTVLFERLTRDKGTGWSFHDAPGWSTQGCEEYFGLVQSPGRNRVLLGDYVARAIADPNQVRFDGDTLYVRNNYLGGPVLVAFLYDTYGAQRVHALFTSSKATFHEALAEAIEPNYRALGASTGHGSRGGVGRASFPSGRTPRAFRRRPSPRFAGTASGCAQDLRIGIASCPTSLSQESRMCRAVCIEANTRARIAAMTRAVPAPSSSASASTAPPPVAPKRQDPYERALRACIYGVLDRGEPPVCRFDRPLDDMDFGQRHCDERCAAATGRGGAIAPPPARHAPAVTRALAR